MTTLVDALASALRGAATYRSLDETPPAAILWPDAAREWRSITPLLAQELPVVTFGDYREEASTGPASWIRCVVERAIPNAPADGELIVVYLPGVAAREIERITECALDVQRLAELQFRGCVWRQSNGDDWTVPAFVGNAPGGLGIELRVDVATAMLRALPVLATMRIEQLKEDAPWRAIDFQRLVERIDPTVTNLRKLIRQGEGQRIEFKETAFYDIRSKGQKNKDVAEDLVIAVVSFMNSREGGTLLIGVANDGTPRGLREDHKLVPENRRGRDDYELRVRQLLFGESIGKQFSDLISLSLVEIDERDVCVIDVAPSGRPVIIQDRERGESFYVRFGNLSQRLNYSAAFDYLRDRWPAS